MSHHNQLETVGVPVAQVGAMARVLGEQPYPCDLAAAGLLHAAVLRSPHAHARIRSISTELAAQQPGVAVVATAADLDGPHTRFGVRVRDQPVLASGVVRHVGEPVAAIAAATPQQALAALAFIQVEYEVLAPVPTIAAALAADAPALFPEASATSLPVYGPGAAACAEPSPNILWEFTLRDPTFDAVWAGAAQVFEDRYSFARAAHYHLEPFACLARWSGEGLSIDTCNQDPFLLRQDLARIFALPEHRVRVAAHATGAGFGAKSYCKLEPLAALLARLARRPVRLVSSFDEEMLSVTQHGAEIVVRTALSRDGAPLAREMLIDLDGGAYADASALVADKAGYRGFGPYRWQAVACRVRVVRTTTAPAGSYRGFGGTQTSWAGERQIDSLCRRLALDPIAWRRAHLLRVGEAWWPGEAGMDSDLSGGLAAVVAALDPPAAPHAARPRGVGVAIGLKDGGGEARPANAAVRLTADGTAIVQAGVVEIGQGATTALAQVAAERLGLPLDRVTVAAVDTDLSPHDLGTHASSGMAVTAAAVAAAADDVVAQLRALAGRAEAVVHAGTVEGEPVASLLKRRFGPYGADVIGRATVQAPRSEGLPLRSQRLYWMPSWAAAEVEVDPLTGQVRVLQLVVAGDPGTAVNVLGCIGQVEGAAIQGLGQALFEHLRVDSAGQPLNATPWSYRAPRATDLPPVFRTLILESGLGPGPFGAKGIGESGNLAIPAAIANAIEAATGAALTSLPLTPEAVFRALHVDS
ncbi:MAG: xanthine dehydrogenase family protein [Alphaproteobacteria bacterium]|nr:xanthine dehydrogenase family protein [Alphaproteobacteria bacterium]